MARCECGSYAINPDKHGRQAGVDLHLCDVCYWRKRAEFQPRRRPADAEILTAATMVKNGEMSPRLCVEVILQLIEQPDKTVEWLMSLGSEKQEA